MDSGGRRRNVDGMGFDWPQKAHSIVLEEEPVFPGSGGRRRNVDGTGLVGKVFLLVWLRFAAVQLCGLRFAVVQLCGL